MTNEMLLKMIESLGSDALVAWYAYLIAHYASMYIVIALILWGVRRAWPTIRTWMLSES